MVPTHAVDIFLAACQAVRLGIDLVPRSRFDKELFAQDWFTERLTSLGLPFAQAGRNRYPDFWVGDEAHLPIEGFEVKSLGFARGKPARKDYDSNSTIPSGRKQDRDVFLVFLLYQGQGASLRSVHSLAITHADLINQDHRLADCHVNESVHGFGSYGDGFIRNRKMYVFPHPFTLDPASLGRRRLIVPAEWELHHDRLERVGELERQVSPERLESYSVILRSRGETSARTTPSPDAGTIRRFEVFEPAEL